ncbi:hypothetical protein [Niallia sp. MER TA 168]|uniref:hypothetical protein n=1 Tax=Niallia sp. MER TA 168 TaxID=2939568 RepID=UPI00203CADC0|nr:hypothetical protein [Niallia sp. MER TA 168]MCM3361245.1 hypothetical protein [Niallia sp. MER TA 168]
MKVRALVVWSLIVLVVLTLFPFCLNLIANHISITSQADFSGWLGFLGSYLGGIISGAGTIATLFFAFYQLHSERKITNENEKRSQAKKISVWIDSENRRAEMLYSIQNASDLPVYQAVITLVGIQGAGPPRNGEEVDWEYPYRKMLATIPPGKFYSVSESGGKGMHIEFGVEIAFTDSNGVYWVRRSNGQLTEIKQSPLEFYNIPLPVSWSIVDDKEPDYFSQNE